MDGFHTIAKIDISKKPLIALDEASFLEWGQLHLETLIPDKFIIRGLASGGIPS